uniref:Cyclin-dependent kinases regulatory subunit n=1 Tax=Nelumbo nucifera TaxID=4432 RepID=A0A822YFU8_NELNU|nr:TPA_asm: hypothetical protein HUJ06_010218 [Nelumbo nucifera]
MVQRIHEKHKMSVDLYFAYQNEWRAFGVQQSRGWVHYAIHRPEPRIMLLGGHSTTNSSRRTRLNSTCSPSEC